MKSRNNIQYLSQVWLLYNILTNLLDVVSTETCHKIQYQNFAYWLQIEDLYQVSAES